MFRRFVIAAILAASLLGGCGADAPASDPADSSAEGFPVTIGEVTIPAPPQRIVSASATHTEILYAIGAGGTVVATDLFSDHPPAARDTEKIDSFNLNVEAIAALNPDLVILAFDPGGAIDGLASVGIPTILFDPPATLDDAYEQFEAIGSGTGRTDQAAALVASMRAEVDQIVAATPQDSGLTYFHELDGNLYTVTSGTFIGHLYGLLGLENVADAVGSDDYGYAQLTAEFLLDADPDLIFLADTKCCGQDRSTVEQRPGWETLSAVREGRVIELDDDVASRWGPRLVDFLRAIAAAATAAA